MKKVFLIAAAVVALAACSKNEVLPSSSINNEISFNVAPRTKALPTGQIEFNKDLTFQTYAYYLPDGQTWASHTATPQTYIDNAKIQFVDPQWKNATHTYYWPKQGKLTFLSWTAVKEDWTSGGKLGVNYATTDATCAHDSGLKFSFNAETDKNKDILVADIAADKNANESVYLATGVPTLFKHQLSYVVFKVRTDKDYTTAGKKFELNSIKFGESLSKSATYQQIATTGVVAGWTETAMGGQEYYKADLSGKMAVVIGSEGAGISISPGQFHRKHRQKGWVHNRHVLVWISARIRCAPIAYGFLQLLHGHFICQQLLQKRLRTSFFPGTKCPYKLDNFCGSHVLLISD